MVTTRRDYGWCGSSVGWVGRRQVQPLEGGQTLVDPSEGDLDGAEAVVQSANVAPLAADNTRRRADERAPLKRRESVSSDRGTCRGGTPGYPPLWSAGDRWSGQPSEARMSSRTLHPTSKGPHAIPPTPSASRGARDRGHARRPRQGRRCRHGAQGGASATSQTKVMITLPPQQSGQPPMSLHGRRTESPLLPSIAALFAAAPIFWNSTGKW